MRGMSVAHSNRKMFGNDMQAGGMDKWVMRLACAAALATLTACGAGDDADPDGAAEGDDDFAEAEVDDDPVGTSAEELRGSCRRGWKRYSFDGGKEIVCWHKFPGLAGTVQYNYRFLNNTNRTWRKKIALDNMNDTNCAKVGAHKWHTFGPYLNYRGAGKPQHVRGC